MSDTKLHPHLFVDIKLLHPDAQVPLYQTDGASGLDLHAKEAITLLPANDLHYAPTPVYKLHLGVALSLPPGWEAQVRPRSSMSAKGIYCALGTIDSDYRGEIGCCLVNMTAKPYTIEKGDRVAQLVFQEVGRASLRMVDKLTATVRGEGRFGSTGKGSVAKTFDAERHGFTSTPPGTHGPGDYGPDSLGGSDF